MMIFESEKAMEDALFEVIERTKVVPWDGRPVLKVVRQARLGSFGVSDIIIVVQDGPHDDDITLVLVELKNTKVKAEHLSQVARYKTFLDETVATVECVLIVTPGMPDETDVCYLIQHSDWLTTYEISVSLDSGLLIVAFQIATGGRLLRDRVQSHSMMNSPQELQWNLKLMAT